MSSEDTTSTSDTAKEETPQEEAPKEETKKEEAPKEEAPKEEAPKEETKKEGADNDPATEIQEQKSTSEKSETKNSAGSEIEMETLDSKNKSTQLEVPPDLARTKSQNEQDERDHAKAGAILKRQLSTDDELSKYFDAQLSAINFQMTCFSFVGFSFVIVYNDRCFDFQGSLRFTDDFEECKEAWYFKLTAWGFWLIFLWRLTAYYTFLSLKKKIIWGYSSRMSAFIKTDLWRWFLIELLVNACFPLPFKGDSGILTTGLTALAFFRIYLVARIFRDNSPIWKERMQIEGHFKKTNTAGADFTVTPQTVFKLIFLQNTILCVCSVFILTLGFMSYIVWLVEREAWLNDDTGEVYEANDYGGERPGEGYSMGQFRLLTSCAWFMIVTMTTLGYGDMVPYSPYGKLFAAIAVIFGILQTSMLVGVVTNRLSPSKFEDKVMTWLELEKVKAQMQDAAARCIQTAWRLKKKARLDAEQAEKDGKEPENLEDVSKRRQAAVRPWIKRLFAARKRFFEVGKKWREEENLEKQKRELTNSMKSIEDKVEKLLSVLQEGGPRAG